MTAGGVPPPDPEVGPLSLCVLASGSRGNAIHLSWGDTAVLIDAGLPGREIERRMRARQLEPEALSALVVTHEHADHLQGVGVMARRFRLPVYISRATAQAAPRLGPIAELRHFACGRPFEIDRLRLSPFALSHDAVDPAGFTVQCGALKAGIATDLGVVTHLVRHHLQRCHLLVLESNHDPELLMSGPYPWPLKQRVRGRTGHLSNGEARDLLVELRHEGLRHVILAHLSEVNNRPEVALREAAAALEPCLRNGTGLHVARQDEATAILTVHHDPCQGAPSSETACRPRSGGLAPGPGKAQVTTNTSA